MVFLRGLCLLFALIICSSCLRFSQKKSIPLKVGSRSWSLKDLSHGLSLHLKNLNSIEKQTNKQLKKIREDYIQQIIFQSLIEDWARKNKIKSPRPKISQEEKKTFYEKGFTLRDILAQKSQTNLYSLFLKDLLKKIPTPSLSQQKMFYVKNKKMFYVNSRCFLKQIVVSSKSLAKRLAVQLKSGASFNNLAVLYSPHSKSIWLDENSLTIFKKVCEQKVGYLSPVLKRQQSYHLAFVQKKQKGKQKSFNESQKTIIKILKEDEQKKEMKKWLKTSLSKTPVFIDKKLLDKIHIQYKRISL